MAVKPIPDGFHTVTPYLLASGVARLIEFLKKAFDAELLECMTMDGDIVMHAQVRIGDSMIMMGDPRGRCAPQPTSLYVYVPDADAAYEKAIQAGGESVMKPADQFYGDRNGAVKDPVGNTWWVATHLEDVPPDEMRRRAAAHGKQYG